MPVSVLRWRGEKASRDRVRAATGGGAPTHRTRRKFCVPRGVQPLFDLTLWHGSKKFLKNRILIEMHTEIGMIGHGLAAAGGGSPIPSICPLIEFLGGFLRSLPYVAEILRFSCSNSPIFFGNGTKISRSRHVRRWASHPRHMPVDGVSRGLLRRSCAEPANAAGGGTSRPRCNQPLGMK